MPRTLLLSLFVALCSAVMAQRHVPVTEGYRPYHEAQVRYERGDYVGARSLLLETKALSELPYQVESEADYLLAAIAYELQEADAIDQIRYHLAHYPETPHRNRLLSLIANRLFFEGKYAEAITQYGECNIEQLSPEERYPATLRLAICHAELHEYAKALIYLAVVDACSDAYRSDAVYLTAYIDYREGRLSKALPAFQGLRYDAAYGAKAALYSADIYLIQRDYDRSLQELAYAKGADSGQEDRILGSDLYELGRYGEAIAPLNRYCQTLVGDATDRTAAYRLGMAYFQTQRYTLAADFLELVTLEEDDTMAQNASLHIGLAYLELAVKSRARMAFERASAERYGISSITEQALYNYAVALHETSYSPFAESVNVFERFLNEYPSSTYAEQVNGYLVEVYMNTRSYEAALQSIEKIHQPGNAILQAKQMVLYRLGTQAFANAQFQTAIDRLTASLNVGNYDRTTTANAYYWRGEAYYRTGDYASAESNLKKYLAQAPQSAGDTYTLALYSIGYATFKQKQYTIADNWFSKFLATGLTEQPAITGDAYNRLGDCRFFVRNFADAAHCYRRAIEVNPTAGDYSLYQIAFVQGLQKDYSGKIETLNQLLSTHPTSPFVDDALYEQGRAYVQMERNAQAIASFTTLVDNYPESAIARKGACEIGLLYYQDDQYTQAIAAYKRVITDYPGSEEALQAQRDLKSIYLDLNRVQEYVDYISTQRGTVALTSNEQDSLTYAAAERTYIRGAIAEAQKSFAHYLQIYPDGDFSLNAHYHLGLIAYNQQRPVDAMTHFDRVLEFPHNKFSEEAMVWNSELYFNAKQYAKALGIYQSLRTTTASSERRLCAQVGTLRCAWMMADGEQTILTANELLNEQKLSPELAAEAHYYRAKCALALQPSQAVSDLTELAKDTRNVYGAEGKYLLAQYHYDHADYGAAESVLLDYIDVSTPHLYWLARSFVLHADVNVNLARAVEARQYLLTLQSNYHANDDIASLIENRLNAIK